MSEEKKNLNNEEEGKKEISLDDLEQVQGGSIKNVNYTPTVDISEDTKQKI